MKIYDLRALAEKLVDSLNNEPHTPNRMEWYTIARALLAAIPVVEAAKSASALLQSDILDGYVDTHTAADLAEALRNFEESVK